MDNSDLIQKLKNQVKSGVRDSYTEPLIKLTRMIIERNESSQDQQEELVYLLEEITKLKQPSPNFLGGSASQL